MFGSRPKSVGPGYRGINQVQLSEFWSHRLPSGNMVQVWVIADDNALNKAVERLSALSSSTVTAFDLLGLNLETGGLLCLATVAFNDTQYLNVYVFDVLQLGERFAALTNFLQCGVSKLVFDVKVVAKICAQQHGIALANVFHAESAFHMLNNRNPKHLVELLEFCHGANPRLSATAKMIDRAPELWTHRPLAKDTVAFAIESLVSLLESGHVLMDKLMAKYKGSANEMVLQASTAMVQQAVDRGFALRNAGITGSERHDPELNSWLARRFNHTAEPYAPGDMGFGGNVVREGDSPRTASWRATVAMVSGVRERSVARQRSESPSLDNWIKQRNNVKEDGPGTDVRQPGKTHRASSLPPESRGVSSSFISEAKPAGQPAGQSPNVRPTVEPVWDHDGGQKNWAEYLEEEQAQGKPDADEQELFQALRKEDIQRNREVMASSKKR